MTHLKRDAPTPKAHRHMQRPPNPTPTSPKTPIETPATFHTNPSCTAGVSDALHNTLAGAYVPDSLTEHVTTSPMQKAMHLQVSFAVAFCSATRISSSKEHLRRRIGRVENMRLIGGILGSRVTIRASSPTGRMLGSEKSICLDTTSNAMHLPLGSENGDGNSTLTVLPEMACTPE